MWPKYRWFVDKKVIGRKIAITLWIEITYNYHSNKIYTLYKNTPIKQATVSKREIFFISYQHKIIIKKC